MTANTKKMSITTTYFFEYALDLFINFSGLQRVDLKPENLKNLHPFPDNYSTRCRNFERITYCTAKAIAQLHNEPKRPYQDIMVSYYLDELNSYQVQNKIGYSSSRYAVLKKRAMTEFTKRFNSLIAKEGLSYVIELFNN